MKDMTRAAAAAADRAKSSLLHYFGLALVGRLSPEQRVEIEGIVDDMIEAAREGAPAKAPAPAGPGIEIDPDQVY